MNPFRSEIPASAPSSLERPVAGGCRLLLAATVAAAAILMSAPAVSAATMPPTPRPGPDRAFVTPRADSLPPLATTSASGLCPRMRALARRGNSRAGLQVRAVASGRVVCSLHPATMRSLASNTKIFTTATALARLGPAFRFKTRLVATGKLDRQGTLHGNLYLKGGGDPALGTGSFLNAYFGGAGTAIRPLAVKLRRAGIKRVTGRLYGDDSVFDRLRGVADSGYATSAWIGPLSGLSLNAGFTSASLSRFSSDPARLATRTLAAMLRQQGVRISATTGMRTAPPSGRVVATQRSPNLAWQARVTNLNSNNFFAEMLLKNLGAARHGRGTTRLGAVVVKRYAAAQGVRMQPVDGSGLTRSNRAGAGGVTRFLIRAFRKPWRRGFLGSLPVAGRDGTLASRMRGSAAAGRCHAKTGTLTGVSALSGYCFSKSGRKYAFSILMNGVYNSWSARLAQDRIAAMIARL